MAWDRELNHACRATRATAVGFLPAAVTPCLTLNFKQGHTLWSFLVSPSITMFLKFTHVSTCGCFIIHCCQVSHTTGLYKYATVIAKQTAECFLCTRHCSRCWDAAVITTDTLSPFTVLKFRQEQALHNTFIPPPSKPICLLCSRFFRYH